ncbi:MAG: FecR domain-containing protein [Prevotella sp.]|nr:FecR domain-containing protein [Prevotella sp.]
MNEKDLQYVDKISELLVRQHLQQLTADEQRELDEWTATSPRRQEIVRRLASAGFLADEHRRQAAVDARQALLAMQRRLSDEQQKQRRGRLVRLSYGMAAAVAVLVVCGAWLWWNRSRVEPPLIPQTVQMAMQQSASSGRRAAVVEEVDAVVDAYPQASQAKAGGRLAAVVRQLMDARRVTTHADKEYWVTLDDGTLVHLNYDTRLLYPDHFSGESRNVVLDGEAYFMVARDKRHPFVVHTPQGDVQVYGTEFNVNTRGHGDCTEVVLVEGSLGVTPADGEEQRLQPGQKCSMFNAQCSLEKVDVAPYIAWNTGEFMFADTRLDALMDAVSHWYGLEVEYGNEQVRSLLFTGSIDRYGKAEAIMRSISKVTGLSIEKNGNHVTIK